MLDTAMESIGFDCYNLLYAARDGSYCAAVRAVVKEKSGMVGSWLDPRFCKKLLWGLLMREDATEISSRENRPLEPVWDLTRDTELSPAWGPSNQCKLPLLPESGLMELVERYIKPSFKERRSISKRS